MAGNASAILRTPQAALASLLLILFHGCATVQDDPALVDTLADQDVISTGDGTDVPPDGVDDTPDAVDAIDAWDAPDTTDAPDAVDILDAPDIFDTFDASDTLDVTDTLDATDVTDAADAAELCGDAVCAPSESCCSLVCTDTSTDFDNCGSCGAPCNASKADECYGSTCHCDGGPVCTGGSYMKCCAPDGCVATDFNDSHCGSCTHSCSGGTTCAFGICS